MAALIACTGANADAYGNGMGCQDFYEHEGVYSCTAEKAVTLMRRKDGSLVSQVMDAPDKTFKVWVVGAGKDAPAMDPNRTYAVYTVKTDYFYGGSMSECDPVAEPQRYAPRGRFICDSLAFEAAFDFESGPYSVSVLSYWHEEPNPSRLEAGTCRAD